MRKYSNKPIEELATELTAGLVRLRKSYVDAAENLIRLIEPAQEYPLEFIVFRLTGFRPQPSTVGVPGISGRSLRGDLLALILDLCDSFTLRTSEYDQQVFDLPAMARRFGISTKTVQRWMDAGLVARRLVFPDGRRRAAFLEQSVQDFTSARQGRVSRSARFSVMTPAERADIIRRARRMVAFSRCSLSAVAGRLARRTQRAVETIRYTIRKHDAEHPDMAVFGPQPSQIDDQQRQAIYQDFLHGAPVDELARAHRRTRGSIYRIINELRARQLLSRPIAYMYNPQFDLPNAEDLVDAPPAAAPPAAQKRAPAKASKAAKASAATAAYRPPQDLPLYLQELYEVPLLDAAKEKDLFRRYNYLKYKADSLRKGIDAAHVDAGKLKQVESLLLQANLVKNQIVRANLRLVVSVAKKHLSGPMTLFELISDGNVALMHAVEKFDYSRGFRFSTYATWAIIRNFARSVPREKYQLDRFSTGHEEVLDIASSLRSYDPGKLNVPELRESIDHVLASLSPIERSILTEHYGLQDEGKTKTLDQMGRRLGLSKERVRQIELRALRKLRTLLKPEQKDLMT